MIPMPLSCVTNVLVRIGIISVPLFQPGLYHGESGSLPSFHAIFQHPHVGKAVLLKFFRLTGGTRFPVSRAIKNDFLVMR